VLRRLGPSGLLILLACLFFAPLVLHPSQVLYSDHSDMLAMHLPMKRFLVHSWQENGELPRWCSYSYGGMPFLSDVQVAAFYPLHVPLLFLPEESVGAAMSWLIVLHVVIAGLAMFAYARQRGLDIAGSLAASIGFMFAGKWLLHVLAGGHYIMIPLAWLPLVLLFLEQSVERRDWWRAVCAGMAFALIVLGTHPQVTLYAGLVTAAWSFAVLKDRFGTVPVRDWVARWVGCGLVAATTAVVLSAVQLLPAIEAAGQASRGVGVPAREIIGVFGFALRGFFGPQSPPGWEINGGFGPLAIGLLVCLPSLRPGQFRWQIGCFVALVAFSFGGAALVQPLPGFRLFQIPVRMLLPAAFPAAYLCGASVTALASSMALAGRLRRILLLCFLAALALSISAFPNPFLKDADLSHVSWLVYAGFWILDGVCVGLVYWQLGARGGWTRLPVRITVIGCLLAEAWLLTRPLVEVRPEESIYPPNEVVEFLVELRKSSADQGPWRVLDRCVYGEGSISPLGSAWPMFGSVKIEPVLGYNSFDVKRYKQLLQMVIGETEPLQPRRGAFGFPITDVFPIEHKSLLDLLGTRYLTQPNQPQLLDADPQGPGQSPAWKLVKVFERPGRVYSFLSGGMATLPPYALYENVTAAPRAFVVHQWEKLDSGWTLDRLAETDFRKVALLADSAEEPFPGPRGASSVEIHAQSADRIKLQVSAKEPGFLVLTENAYPGWHCLVDGKEAAIHQADFAFQGVFVPAGRSEVIFEFAPRSLRVGQVISSAGVIVVMAILLAAGISKRRKKASLVTVQVGHEAL
jgi:hypothetical protein